MGLKTPWVFLVGGAVMLIVMVVSEVMRERQREREARQRGFEVVPRPGGNAAHYSPAGASDGRDDLGHGDGPENAPGAP